MDLLEQVQYKAALAKAVSNYTVSWVEILYLRAHGLDDLPTFIKQIPEYLYEYLPVQRDVANNTRHRRDCDTPNAKTLRYINNPFFIVSLNGNHQDNKSFTTLRQFRKQIFAICRSSATSFV